MSPYCTWRPATVGGQVARVAAQHPPAAAVSQAVVAGSDTQVVRQAVGFHWGCQSVRRTARGKPRTLRDWTHAEETAYLCCCCSRWSEFPEE
jgi:uncharacterized membrane protein